MMLETDSELIRRTLTGERLAAERLAERHRRAALETAFRALKNADDAQDVAQEALVYALQRLSDLRDHGTFAAWLKSVTLSRCADYRRRRGTRYLGEPITIWNEATEETDFAERLVIRQAVARLSEAHRATALLHYVGGWSREEVAKILDIPVNTVRSRLMTARRTLRADTLLAHRRPPERKTMPATAESFVLSPSHLSLLHAAFPEARILSVEERPEPWMPFSPRVRLTQATGEETTVDFRRDIDPARAALLPALERYGIPGPRLLHDPTADADGWLSLCETPRGENLLLWTLGGTPHRVRLANERAFESIDRLQNATDSLLADPAGRNLPRRTLANEAAVFDKTDSEWHYDPWFTAALDRVRKAVQDIHDPLVYTDHLHFFPNFVRIQAGEDPINEPMGWPGDARMRANPLTEFVSPFGYLGDPLLGLAMVWVYDCYPFVHTGFVEQFLWRRNVTRREFAPRLALKALQTIYRELPVTRPAEGADYWDALHGYVDQSLEWMG